MRKLILLLFLFLNVSVLFGQNTIITINNDGTVGKIPNLLHPKQSDVLKESLNTSIKVIDTVIIKEKTALIEDIIKRLDQTIRVIESNKEDYSLLFDIKSVINKYKEAKAKLETLEKDISTTLNLNLFEINSLPYIKDALNSVWNNKVDPSLTKRNDFFEYKIYKPSYSNSFYAKYYENVFVDTYNFRYSNLSKRDLYKDIQSFKENLFKLKKYLDNPFEHDKARQTALVIEKNPLYLLFNEKWLFQILWMNKGEVRINPFDNTSSSVFLNQSKWSINEDQTYQTYLSNLINQRKEVDTSFNYLLFKEILKEKNSIGRVMFNVVRDSMQKSFEKEFGKYKIGYSYLNLIKIPIDTISNHNLHYRSVLANKEIIGGDYEDLKYLDAEKKITWAIHNKPESQQLKLVLQKKETLKAEGKTEQEINRFFTEAAGLYSILNPTVDVFSSLAKTIKNPFLANYKSKEYLKSNSDDNLKEEISKINSSEKSDSKKQREVEIYLNHYIDSLGIIYKRDSIILEKGTLYLSLLESSTTPPEPWTPNKGTTPIFETKLFRSDELDTLNTYKYAIQSIIKKDTTIIDAVKFKVGKYVRFNLSGGLAYTFNPSSQNKLFQDAQGSISFKNTSQSYRGIALLNVYLSRKGMLKPDDHFFAKSKPFSRVFAQVGVGIPEPLNNFYSGLGYNIGPGINASIGLHLSGQKRYEVVNNVVINENRIYVPRTYVSISLDPSNLIKALGLFGK